MRRLLVLASALLVLQSCTFVAYHAPREYERSVAQLDDWIAEAERLRASGVSLSAWCRERDWDRRRVGKSWDEVLCELYAQRSAAVVREVHYVSATGTVVWFWHGGLLRCDGWSIVAALRIGIAAPLTVTADVVGTPVYCIVNSIRQACISEDDLVQAVADIHRARELGYTEERVWGSGNMGWPRPYSRHLDVIGYDAQWLREHRREQ